jgi:hypothetical protein
VTATQEFSLTTGKQSLAVAIKTSQELKRRQHELEMRALANQIQVEQLRIDQLLTQASKLASSVLIQSQK